VPRCVAGAQGSRGLLAPQCQSPRSTLETLPRPISTARTCVRANDRSPRSIYLQGTCAIPCRLNRPSSIPLSPYRRFCTSPGHIYHSQGNAKYVWGGSRLLFYSSQPSTCKMIVDLAGIPCTSWKGLSVYAPACSIALNDEGVPRVFQNRLVGQ